MNEEVRNKIEIGKVVNCLETNEHFRSEIFRFFSPDTEISTLKNVQNCL